MIEINNLTAKAINKDFLKKIAKEVLRREKEKNLNLSIALVGPARIREINKKYRKKNKTTDVLSFSYNSEQNAQYIGRSARYNSTEIIICPAEVKKNAKKSNSTFKKELTRCLIHGILHVLGYRHEKNKKKAREMKKKENYYLWRSSQ